MKWMLRQCLPRYLNKYWKEIKHDQILTYVVLTSTEARWLLWWETNSETTVPYAIRATQSHKGADIDLGLMYKEITLENFSDVFGRGSRWHLCAKYRAARCIAEYGLCPSGNEYLVVQRWRHRPNGRQGAQGEKWQLQL